MEELTLIVRIFLGTLLLSTSVSKFRNLEEHMLIIKEYRLLPSFLLYPFARIESAFELLTGALLFSGVFQQTGAMLAGLLLTIYSVAIAVNLLRGRRDISCGCGGAAGDHPISWWLVGRNLLLLIMSGWVFTNPSQWGSVENIWLGETSQLFHPLVLQDMMTAWLALLFFTMATGLWEMYSRFRIGDKQIKTATLAIGEKAPVFREKDQNGMVVQVTELGEKHTFMLFTNDTCGTCKAVIPELPHVSNRYPDVAVIVVSNPIYYEKGLEVPLGISLVRSDDLMSRFYIQVVPTAVLIDNTGTIVAIKQVSAFQDIVSMFESPVDKVG
ncbi:MauE/DoxX family redox-associated membrane protein [Brevibacillus sp. NRS-1366]|uniref:MauE/DoxX family redox-associated membrane protein n=1 Tax=Brevibacillus sp. NRS-1366 TaxID=3233899 RepID=UPI003D1E7AB5